jgi:hypothetical protein
MFAIFKEDRVPQPFYRSTRIGRARRPRTKADMSRARSCGPDRISQETQWHASPRRLSDFLSDVRVAEEPWRAVLRRTLQAVAGALDRLVPPHPLDREVELPPEWFKYPPI